MVSEKELKELRKLGKTEMLELYLDSEKENERLKTQVKNLKEKIEEKENEEHEEIKNLKAKLEDKNIMLEEAGNIAEATLRMFDIFEIAQGAADEYLKNIKMLNNRQEQLLEQKEEEANRKIENMLNETRRECDRMKENAEIEITMKRDAFEEKMNKFISAHDGLKEILAVMGK